MNFCALEIQVKIFLTVFSELVENNINLDVCIELFLFSAVTPRAQWCELVIQDGYQEMVLCELEIQGFYIPGSTPGHCGHDRMVVGFITTYAISAYHH
jgi:hypothetical protein